MDSAQIPRPGQPAGAAALPDPARTEKVKDLLHSLANTASAMKIFPSEHATVTHFVDQLAAKFADFLAVHAKLQIGIEEFSFTYEGKPAYTDEAAIKSLPFFFFKDGLHSLLLLPGPGPARGLRSARVDQNGSPEAGRGLRHRRRALGARLP